MFTMGRSTILDIAALKWVMQQKSTFKMAALDHP